MKNKITSFKPHYNHVNEAIQAEHLNELQESVNQLEYSFLENQQGAFRYQALINFQNQDHINAVQFFDLSNQYQAMSTLGFCLREGIQLEEGVHSGSFRTNILRGHLPQSLLNRFTLLVDSYEPVGSQINFFLKSSDGRWTKEIKPNSDYSFNASFLEAEEDLEGYQLIVMMKVNHPKESPVLYQMALLFEDQAISQLFKWEESK